MNHVITVKCVKSTFPGQHYTCVGTPDTLPCIDISNRSGGTVKYISSYPRYNCLGKAELPLLTVYKIFYDWARYLTTPVNYD